MHLLLGWRTRLEAETVQSGNSLVRTGCAWAEGVCCLQNPPLSLPQTQPEAQSTIPGPALPACCTVLAPALSGQGTTPCQRSCSFLRDEHSSFLELPELCHWVTAPSTDVLWRQRAAIWAPPRVLQGTELYHTVVWTHPHHNRGRETAVHLVRLLQAGSVWKLLFDHILYQQDEPITSLGKELLLYPCGQEDQEPDYISLFEWTSPSRWAAPGLYSQRTWNWTWNQSCWY